MKKINLKLNIINLKNIKLNKSDFLISAKKNLEKKLLYGNFEVDLEFTDDNKMQIINKKYRNINRSTDVLSFPTFNLTQIKKSIHKQKDNYVLLGLILISYPQARMNAENAGLTLEKEILHLFDHGLNHLVGFHHK